MSVYEEVLTGNIPNSRDTNQQIQEFPKNSSRIRTEKPKS